HPDGQQIVLPMRTVDDLDLGPDLIHLDIEGGEYQALVGARQTIEAKLPNIIVRTHGLETDGIGGSVGDIACFLESRDYPLFDLEEGYLISAVRYGTK